MNTLTKSDFLFKNQISNQKVLVSQFPLLIQQLLKAEKAQNIGCKIYSYPELIYEISHNQMKMFLTRMGKNAKFMITGDPGQIDLPRSSISGLKEANLILQNIDGIDIVYLDDKDVIRHKVVKKIIDAYKKTEHAN